jgi:hypothetical protein
VGFRIAGSGIAACCASLAMSFASGVMLVTIACRASRDGITNKVTTITMAASKRKKQIASSNAF